MPNSSNFSFSARSTCSIIRPALPMISTGAKSKSGRSRFQS
jgi:hypothetical protein